MDKNGNILWQETYGGTLYDFIYEIVLLSDTNLLLMGHSSSDASLDKSENSIGQRDYWVVKIDTSGAIIWENTIGGTGNDLGIRAKELDEFYRKSLNPRFGQHK